MVDKNSIELRKCEDSRYIEVCEMRYTENGVQKRWEVVKSADSVSILLYNRDSQNLIIVRQFRPAVFLRNNDGYMFELCAGLVDKPKKSLEQIAVEEVFEECGYEIPTNRLQFVNSFYNSVGISGARQTVYLAEVSKEDKHALGGGTDGEKIEVLYLKASEALEFVRDEDYDKTPSLAFGINYFFYQYRPSHKRK